MQQTLTESPGSLFLKRISDILSETHYNTFFHDTLGMAYENKFTWHFSAILAALLPESTKSLEGLSRKEFVKILRSRNIRHICEVGPGHSSSSFVYPLADVFAEAGCKTTVVGRDLNKEAFEREDIICINAWAGELCDPTLEFDLVVARDVFSFGGQATAGMLTSDTEKVVEGIGTGVLDLVSSMNRKNPYATIIASEFYDILPLKKEEIERVAKICLWHSFSTTNGWIYRNDDSYPAKLRNIFQAAPSFVMLQNLDTNA